MCQSSFNAQMETVKDLKAVDPKTHSNKTGQCQSELGSSDHMTLRVASFRVIATHVDHLRSQGLAFGHPSDSDALLSLDALYMLLM